MTSSMFANIPPAIIMLLAALIIPFLQRHLRMAFVIIVPVITLSQVWQIPVGVDVLSAKIAGFDIIPLYAHPYTHIFATAFCIAAFGGAAFGLLQSKVLETSAAFLYAGSAIGVIFSGDFISMFIYWELMAVGSTLIIFASDREKAMRAGVRYALIHLLGGIILMTGIIGHIMLSGSTRIVPFETDTSILFPEYAIDVNGIVMWLVLVGVLINAAVPPISAWLADSYPESSSFGAVFLSAFTTKTSVFLLITLFAGTEFFIYIGVVMAFYGIIYAILENDMRRILAYSIINQLGFMITGIGIGTPLALSGVATHAFASVIYQALLFMSAGSVLHMTGKSKCSELGGLCHSMKITTICAVVGALSIAAFPLTSGFVTKSMILTATKDEELQIIWSLLLVASAGVFAHAGMKFTWFVFFQKDSGLRPKDPQFNMQFAMILFAVLCILPVIPSIAEHTIYKMLPVMPEYVSYTHEHVITQFQLLLFSALAFFMLLPMLKPTDTISLDFDWFYRGIGHYVLSVIYYIGRFPARIGLIVAKKLMRKSSKLVLHMHNPDGIMARSWSLGVIVMWTCALLGVYLVIYYSM